MDEFYRRLSLTRRNWRLVGRRIRNADGECPVCAVADVEDVYEAWWRQVVLDAAKLDRDEAELIANAADDIGASLAEKPIRRKLLEACGLT